MEPFKFSHDGSRSSRSSNIFPRWTIPIEVLNWIRRAGSFFFPLQCLQIIIISAMTTLFLSEVWILFTALQAYPNPNPHPWSYSIWNVSGSLEFIRCFVAQHWWNLIQSLPTTKGTDVGHNWAGGSSPTQPPHPHPTAWSTCCILLLLDLTSQGENNAFPIGFPWISTSCKKSFMSDLFQSSNLTC